MKRRDFDFRSIRSNYGLSGRKLEAKANSDCHFTSEFNFVLQLAVVVGCALPRMPQPKVDEIFRDAVPPLEPFLFLVAMWFLPIREILEGRPPLQNSGPRPGIASLRRYLRRVFVCCSCLDFFSLVAAFFDVMDFLLRSDRPHGRSRRYTQIRGQCTGERSRQPSSLECRGSDNWIIRSSALRGGIPLNNSTSGEKFNAGRLCSSS